MSAINLRNNSSRKLLVLDLDGTLLTEDKIITERAMIVITNKGLVLKEVATGYSVKDVLMSTEAELTVANDLKMEAF